MFGKQRKCCKQNTTKNHLSFKNHTFYKYCEVLFSNVYQKIKSWSWMVLSTCYRIFYQKHSWIWDMKRMCSITICLKSSIDLATKINVVVRTFFHPVKLKSIVFHFINDKRRSQRHYTFLKRPRNLLVWMMNNKCPV